MNFATISVLILLLLGGGCSATIRVVGQADRPPQYEATINWTARQ